MTIKCMIVNRNEALHPGEPEPAPNSDNLLDFPPFCRVLGAT